MALEVANNTAVKRISNLKPTDLAEITGLTVYNKHVFEKKMKLFPKSTFST